MSTDPQALLSKADKAAAGASGGFSFFGGKTEKLEGAVDLYLQAANQFRLAKNGKMAGQVFEKAAGMQKDKLNEPGDAANTLQDAAKAYRKTDPEDAARCLEQVVRHYTNAGNFRRAATQQQQLAEIYEQEVGDNKRAMAAYATAADWFEEDNAPALANKLFLKSADLLALDGDYYKAIELYEKVARQSINSNTMRWSVKNYLMQAGLCHLATNDIVGATKAIESYGEIDPSFSQQMENKLLMNLAEAVKDGNQERFSEDLYNYDRVAKLDNWKTTICLRIKQNIEQEVEDFS